MGLYGSKKKCKLMLGKIVWITYSWYLALCLLCQRFSLSTFTLTNKSRPLPPAWGATYKERKHFAILAHCK